MRGVTSHSSNFLGNLCVCLFLFLSAGFAFQVKQVIKVKPGPSLIPPLILEQRLHLYDTLLFPREGSDLDKHTLHFHKARQFLKSFSQLMTTPGQRRLNEIVHVNHKLTVHSEVEKNYRQLNLRFPDSGHCANPFILHVVGIMNEYAISRCYLLSAYLHVKHCQVDTL